MWHNTPRRLSPWIALAAAALLALPTLRGNAAPQPAFDQAELIRILQSDAPPAEKAITCKRLAIVGTAEAVPAIAALLPNPELSSWARIALEAIPGPASDEALRNAIPVTQNRILIGVINSIGVRRDPLAVSALVAQLNTANPDVVAAAAVALGHIGGPAAAQALASTLPKASAEAQAGVAEGCILCAEGLLRQGQAADAAHLYDLVRLGNYPQPKVLEATRGAILARQAAGLPLLLDQLRSPDRGFLAVGLSTAREMPGTEITQALVQEVRRAGPDRQGLILLALGDRHDPAVLPAVTEFARTGSPQLRIVAVTILERSADLASIPVLLDAAAQENAELAKTAKLALTRIGAETVDADLLRRLQQSSGTLRLALIEILGQRGVERAAPAVLPFAADADPATRRAALDTVGTLGTGDQIPALVSLLGKTSANRDRADIEKALVAIAGRTGGPCVPTILPLTRSNDRAQREAGLHILVAAGGPEALAAVTAALKDPDASVQDEAVRTLASWPNTWPEDAGVAEPLLTLAKSGSKPSHQIQGARGYLQFVREDKQLSNPDKLTRIQALLPYVQRPEEKQLVVSVLSTVPTPESLTLLETFTADTATTEEACLAIVNIVASPRLPKSATEARQKALQTVLDHSKNETTLRKARELK